MSLLTIVQGAAVRCNLAQPNAAFSSTDPQIQQIIAFAQDTGRELMERGGWRNLKFETSIVGDGSTTLFSLPSDFKRLCPSDKPQQSPFVSMQRPSIPIRGPVNDEWLNAAKALVEQLCVWAPKMNKRQKTDAVMAFWMAELACIRRVEMASNYSRSHQRNPFLTRSDHARQRSFNLMDIETYDRLVRQ